MLLYSFIYIQAYFLFLLFIFLSIFIFKYIFISSFLFYFAYLNSVLASRTIEWWYQRVPFSYVYFSVYSFPSHTIHTHERCGRWLGRQHVHTHLHFVHLSGGHLSDYTSKSPFVYLHFFSFFSFTLSLEKIKVLKKQKK